VFCYNKKKYLYTAQKKNIKVQLPVLVQKKKQQAKTTRILNKTDRQKINYYNIYQKNFFKKINK